MSHKTDTIKIPKLNNALFFLVFLSALLFVFTGLASADKADPESKIYALACSTSGTHVVVSSAGVLSCTSKGGDSPNTVSVQGIGEKGSSTEPYPNTIELTTVRVTCKGSTPKDPKLGSLVTDFKCQNNKKPTSVEKVSRISAAKNPKTQNNPYTIQGGNTIDGSGNKIASIGSSGSSTKTCDDPNNALCAPESGICKNGVCQDSAADPKADCDKQGCDFIKKYINPGINLLTFVFGLLAVASLIFGGIQYSASTGDPQKISQAKSRITSTIIAIVCYFFLYGFLQFLIPGGIFKT